MIELILAGIAIYLGLQLRARSQRSEDRLARIELAVDRIDRELGALKLRRGPAVPPAPDFDEQHAANDDRGDAPVAAAPQEPQPVTSVPPIGGDAEPPAAVASGPGGGDEAPTGASFEERLGTRWAVWAGGLALALGGIFLVRFSIEAGLIRPGVRVALGALLAAALIAGGEYLRRSEQGLPIALIPSAHIPSVLTAAGTTVAFGTVYAAHALYGFIGPAAAFVLLGATALGTMLAAAIHGPALAGVGMLGAYVTPLLVSSEAPNPWPAALYLVAVTAAAYLLASMRGWRWLAICAVIGAVIWGVLLAGPLGMTQSDFLNAAAVYALAQLALAGFFLAIEPHAGEADADAAPDWMAAGALAALGAVVGLILIEFRIDIGTRQLVAVAAIAILGFAAWRAAAVAAAAALAGLLVAVLQVAWPDLALPADTALSAPDAVRLMRLPDNVNGFLAFSTFAAVAIAVTASLRLWRGPLLPLPTAALYGAAATLVPLVALILAYLRVTQFDSSIPFALAGALLAGALAFGAESFHRGGRGDAYNVGAGTLSAGAIAALCFALFACLERGYLTVVLALAALGTAYVATLRDIPVLRYAVSAIGLIVLARVVADPRIMGDGVGATPIFNWLLIGYGVPAAAFAASARLLERMGDSLAVRLSDALAVIFTALLAFFQIRHLTNGGDVLARSSSLIELGLMTLVAIGLSYALARFNNGKRNLVFDVASLIFGAASAFTAAFGLFVFRNPLLTGDHIRTFYVFDDLTLAYLLPGLAALFVARHTRSMRPALYVRAAGILAVALLFAYVTLEVRRAFHGANLSLSQPTLDAEHWTYSAVWLVLAVVFLAYGLVRGSLEARMASLALIVVSALKITFFDLAGISGLWRALSFLCLGAVLIGIGLVYQRYVFARPAGGAPSEGVSPAG